MNVALSTAQKYYELAELFIELRDSCPHGPCHLCQGTGWVPGERDLDRIVKFQVTMFSKYREGALSSIIDIHNKVMAACRSYAADHDGLVDDSITIDAEIEAMYDIWMEKPNDSHWFW